MVEHELQARASRGEKAGRNGQKIILKIGKIYY